ncbi:MAG: hypothetical protein QXT48_03325 [Thermoplasmatales archaeon]
MPIRIGYKVDHNNHLIVVFDSMITDAFINNLYPGYDIKRTITNEAGLTDGLFLLLGFIGGVVGGRMLSSERQRGWFTYFILILTGLSFSLISIAENFQTLLVFTSIAGFSLVSGFTVLYIESLKSINYRPIIPFALAFVNCLSIAIGSVSPYFFTFLLDKVNSHSGWLVLGVIGLALIPLLYFSRRNYNH